MSKALTDAECKDIIRRLGKRLKVDPKLIVTRLMSEEDKKDMRDGNLPLESLRCHVKVWIDTGLPDYAHGKTVPLAMEKCVLPGFQSALAHSYFYPCKPYGKPV